MFRKQEQPPADNTLPDLDINLEKKMILITGNWTLCESNNIFIDSISELAFVCSKQLQDKIRIQLNINFISVDAIENLARLITGPSTNHIDWGFEFKHEIDEELLFAKLKNTELINNISLIDFSEHSSSVLVE